MTADDDYTAALAELAALKRRLAALEAYAAQLPPEPASTPAPATFGDALSALRRTGSASGPAIDALRRRIVGRPEPATAPSRDQLAEATRVVTASLRGAPTIEGAYQAMQARAARRDAVEMADPGALGRVDPTDPATATAIDKLDKILKGQRP